MMTNKFYIDIYLKNGKKLTLEYKGIRFSEGFYKDINDKFVSVGNQLIVFTDMEEQKMVELPIDFIEGYETYVKRQNV